MPVSVSTNLDGGKEIVIKLDREFNLDDDKGILASALKDAAKEYAAHWLAKNKDKVYALMDAKAIANILLIEVAKEAKEELKK